MRNRENIDSRTKTAVLANLKAPTRPVGNASSLALPESIRHVEPYVNHRTGRAESPALSAR